MLGHAGTREGPTPGDGAVVATGDLDDRTVPSEIGVALRPSSLPACAGVVTLRGEHDLATSAELEQVLASIDGDVLVDLSACPFVDSSVIGVIIRTARALARDGHGLELVIPAANTAVSRIADVVGLRMLVSVVERLPVGEVALSESSFDASLR